MQRSVFSAAKQPRHSIKSATQTDINNSRNGPYGISGPLQLPHCGLMPAIFTTLSHFAASAAMNLSNAAALSTIGTVPTVGEPRPDVRLAPVRH